MARPKNMRRQFLINPHFQYDIIAKTLLLSAVILAVLYGANVFMFSKFVNTGLNIGLPPQHIYFRFIAEEKVMMNRIFLGLSVVITSIVSTWGLLISNRIAGPLHRLCKDLKKMSSEGNYTKIVFRKGDYFPEVAEATNVLIGNIQGNTQVKDDKAA